MRKWWIELCAILDDVQADRHVDLHQFCYERRPIDNRQDFKRALRQALREIRRSQSPRRLRVMKKYNR